MLQYAVLAFYMSQNSNLVGYMVAKRSCSWPSALDYRGGGLEVTVAFGPSEAIAVEM